jgi:50S ribosomal protein L16 3-hydroxylase
LDARTQLLYDERHVFINGEAMDWPSRASAAARTLKKLANTRSLSAAEVSDSAPLSLLYQWYLDGFLRID